MIKPEMMMVKKALALVLASTETSVIILEWQENKVWQNRTHPKNKYFVALLHCIHS
jgi:hypothetical protein